MASGAAVRSMVKSMVGAGRQQRFIVTSTAPKMKPASGIYDPHYSSQQHQQLNPTKPSSGSSWSLKGDYVPVYVSAGLILLAGLIVHTINQSKTIPDTMCGDAFTRSRNVETLKSVGVDPKSR